MHSIIAEQQGWAKDPHKQSWHWFSEDFTEYGRRWSACRKMWHNGMLLSAPIITHSSLCSECLAKHSELNIEEYDNNGSD